MSSLEMCPGICAKVNPREYLWQRKLQASLVPVTSFSSTDIHATTLPLRTVAISTNVIGMNESPYNKYNKRPSFQLL